MMIPMIGNFSLFVSAVGLFVTTLRFRRAR